MAREEAIGVAGSGRSRLGGRSQAWLKFKIRQHPPTRSVAPLIAAQGCWGGVITFVPDQRKLEVEGCRCSDAQKYHLEFDSDLKLIAKRFVR